MSELDRKAIAILRDAPDTDPDSLETYISQHCRTDPALAERVRTLLARVRAEVSAPAIDDPGNRTGTIVAGRYRLLERLGVGGMGEVHRAERIDGDFDQEVALKLVHGGFASLIERFRREKQILARLTHPNIAHLIDGGIDGDGTPWLAMEYVAGERITDWCDARQLDLAARTELVGDTCDAVQFAHRNLVVHRDIKPANILIADDGTPKLLDFGIAKLLDNSDREATQTMAMTPAYAAPEQRRGEPVTTATDVYQLGLVLYELLAGTSLHQARQQDRKSPNGPAEPVSMIRAFDAMAARDADLAAQVARQRGTSVDRLRSVLKGDVGRIVAKALHDSPTERYGSARELADDLARWRGQRPILARRESALYRAGKFLRRHRVAVAFASVAIASLVMAVAGMAWKTAEAGREASRANAVQEFLIGLFESNTPTSSRAELPGTAELLARGVERVRSEFADQPATRADLMAAIGRIYLQQSLYEQAEPLVTEALATREQLHGPADPLVLESLIDSIKLDITTGRIDEARTLLDRAATLALAGADDATRIELSLGECIVRFYEGRYPDSAAECLRTVSMIESAAAPPVGLVAPAYAQLSAALQREGRIDESIERTLEGLERLRALHGQPHYDEMMVYSSLIMALRSANRYDDAVSIGRDAVALSEGIFEGAHPEFADNLFALGNVLSVRGDPAEAEQYLRRAIAMYEEVYGPSLTLSTSEMLYARLTLANLLNRMGRAEEAETLLRRTLAELEAHPQLRDYPATHAEVWIYLARSRVAQDDRDDARQLLHRALAVFDTPKNAERYRSLIGLIHTTLAMIATAEGLSDEAAAQARLALERQDAPSSLLRAAEARLALGRALLDAGDTAGASNELAQALAAYADASGDTSPETIATRIEAARASTMAGDAGQAATHLAAARAGAASLPATHPLRIRLDAMPRD